MVVGIPQSLRCLLVLGLCLATAGGAAAAAAKALVWKVVLAATSRTDDDVVGAMVTRDGGIVAQLNVFNKKAASGSPAQTRFVRVHPGGAVSWLAATPEADEGGLLAEAADGGWFSVSIQPISDPSNADLVVRRRDPIGVLLWTATWDAPDGARLTPRAVAVDRSGNLVIAGEADALPVLWKYDDAGNLLWVHVHDRQGAYTHLLIDSQDRAVAAGTLAQSQDGFLVTVMNSDGTLAWSDHYHDPAHPNELLTALALSPTDEIVVSGFWRAAKSDESGVNTVRYLASGLVRWSQRYEDPDLGILWPTGVVVDEEENVYVSITGYGRRRDTCLLIKYDLTAEPRWWEIRKNARGLLLPTGNLRIDPCGNLYAFRYTTRGAPRFNVATYNTYGNVLRDFSYNMGTEPLLADLDRFGNALALSNPRRNKLRKRDGLAVKVRRVDDPKKCR